MCSYIIALLWRRNGGSTWSTVSSGYNYMSLPYYSELIRVFVVFGTFTSELWNPWNSRIPSFSLSLSLFSFLKSYVSKKKKKKTIKWKASFSIILHIYCILTPSLQFGVELDPSLLSCEKQIPNLPTARDLRRSSNHTEVSISAPFRTCDFY